MKSVCVIVCASLGLIGCADSGDPAGNPGGSGAAQESAATQNGESVGERVDTSSSMEDAQSSEDISARVDDVSGPALPGADEDAARAEAPDVAGATVPPDTSDDAGLAPGSDAGELLAGLNGQAPEEAIPVPEFVATNHDGGVRGPEDLVGQPTVLWFFPFAGTPG